MSNNKRALLPHWQEEQVCEVLAAARSYYDNRERLIYAYAGKTFLGSGVIWDEDFDRRGNIDCSTYIHLVLQGVHYQDSPFVTGVPEIVPSREAAWQQHKLMRKLKENPVNRMANEIARSYWEEGLCYEDMALVHPGDLVFYRSPEVYVPFYREHGCFREICHVGIVAEDGKSMYNATGLPDKKEQEAQHLEAIQLTDLTAERMPLLFARPIYA